MSFGKLESYLTQPELMSIKKVQKPGGLGSPRVLVSDCPLFDIERFIAKSYAMLTSYNTTAMLLYLGNEGGAILNLLYALGYKFEELNEIFSNNLFDISKLIGGKTFMPKKLHKLKNGGVHKGLRLREAIETLIEKKIKTDVPNGATMKYFMFYVPVPFAVMAYCVEKSKVEIISNLTHPDASVADVILASCSLPSIMSPVKIGDFTYRAISDMTNLTGQTIMGYIGSSHIKLSFYDQQVLFFYSSTYMQTAKKYKDMGETMYNRHNPDVEIMNKSYNTVLSI